MGASATTRSDGEVGEGEAFGPRTVSDVEDGADSRLLELADTGRLRAHLAGRGKRDVILGMLARSPGPAASNAAVRALATYPLAFLLLAAEFPTRIWLLDDGEKVSSAAILTPEMRARRWHAAQIGVDDCLGLTDAADGYVAMVATWRSALVLRHEFAHVITTFFTSTLRRDLADLYARAHADRRFAEPLARLSLGEFAACAVTAAFFPARRAALASADASLHDLVARLLQEAERASVSFLG